MKAIKSVQVTGQDLARLCWPRFIGARSGDDEIAAKHNITFADACGRGCRIAIAGLGAGGCESELEVRNGKHIIFGIIERIISPR